VAFKLKLSPNTGLTEAASKKISARQALEEQMFYRNLIEQEQNRNKAKMMALRARGAEPDLGDYSGLSDISAVPSDFDMNDMMDHIENMPSGDRTNALHQVMRQAAGVQYPRVHDLKFNNDIVRHIQNDSNVSTYGTFMDKMVGNQQASENNPAGLFDPMMRARKQGGGNMGIPGQIGDQQIASRFKGMAADSDAGPETNKFFGQQFAAQFPNMLVDANQQDQALASAMNADFRDAGMFQDPGFDLEQEGEILGEGAYGAARLAKDSQGNDAVIKQGNIGPDEFKAFHRLRDNPHFPNLLAGRLDKPFAHKAQLAFNPMRDDDMGPLASNMLGVEDKQGMGEYAMDLAPGEELGDMGVLTEDGGILAQDQDLREEMIRQFWDVKGQMHKAGVAHNDLHGGNIKYDEDNDMMHIIDMGLAEVDTLAAFREAMGGYAGGDGQTNSPERWQSLGRDSNISYPMGAMMGRKGGFMPSDMADRLDENFNGIVQKFEEKYGSRFDDENDNLQRDHMGEMLYGGLREVKDTGPNGQNYGREELAELFGMTEGEGEDRKMTKEGERELQSYIEQLYDGVSFDPGERKGAKEQLQASQEKIQQQQPANKRAEFKGGGGDVASKVRANKRQAAEKDRLGAMDQGWGQKIPSEFGNNPYADEGDENYMMDRDVSALNSAAGHAGRAAMAGGKAAGKAALAGGKAAGKAAIGAAKAHPKMAMGAAGLAALYGLGNAMPDEPAKGPQVAADAPQAQQNQGVSPSKREAPKAEAPKPVAQNAPTADRMDAWAQANPELAARQNNHNPAQARPAAPRQQQQRGQAAYNMGNNNDANVQDSIPHFGLKGRQADKMVVKGNDGRDYRNWIDANEKGGGVMGHHPDQKFDRYGQPKLRNLKGNF
tara:strand:- start:811 stop:3468 length:2658 start_codon:yes stop_codon:yes gene_type:complete